MEMGGSGGLKNKMYSLGNSEKEKKARDYANYEGTGGKDKWDESTALVGSFKPNGYGLFDMAGNVYEWCSDRYGENYYSNSPSKNPPGPGAGTKRVWRGGGWGFNIAYLRVAYRNCYSPARRYYRIGFRCVSGSDKP